MVQSEAEPAEPAVSLRAEIQCAADSFEEKKASRSNSELSNVLAPLFDQIYTSTSKEECHVQCVHMI